MHVDTVRLNPNSLVLIASKNVQIREFLGIYEIIHFEWKRFQFQYNLYLKDSKIAMNMTILDVRLSRGY